MAIKKSDLYRSLWASCDELRGGMDASQYKDYILTLLFVKYVSDKQKADPNSLIEVPEDGSFDDMIVLKGDSEIGDKINKIIGRLAEANHLQKVIDLADFNDEEKLGKGKEMQDRLSKLVAIFADIDFRGSRAEGDDLLGDAYEYLMRHFATESGKSKGQFYTPAEVSRIIAKVIGIGSGTRQDQTVCDPTCGSGSLLLKVAAEAPRGITIYGQEKDNATWALCKMNMILHNNEDADIQKGDALTSPQFTNGAELRTFDFAVANPPFSVKSWSNGLENDYGRFEFGMPPPRNGDFAFLLHVLKSLKSTGKAAIILPHGVLFRGNAEAAIRRQLLKRGYIKGIIGLPPNLFYGTGIPACIIVLDKENAQARTGVFMIAASKGFMKDGAKNRLRSQDIHKIVDVFTNQIEIERYSRLVSMNEIGNDANDFNLNIARYINSSDPEDVQDLSGHVHGGIPDPDIEALSAYWTAFPQLRLELFKANRHGFSDLAIDRSAVHQTILDSAEFQKFSVEVGAQVATWFEAHRGGLEAIDPNTRPNDLIAALSDDLLARFRTIPLLDEYDVYEQLMGYWHSTMHDDVFLVMTQGWRAAAEPRKAIENKDRRLSETPDLTSGSGRSIVKYKTDLIPPNLIVGRYFADEQLEVAGLVAEAELATRAVEEYEEEHAVEDGLLGQAMEDDKIGKALAKARLRAARAEGSDPEEIGALQHLIGLYDAEASAKGQGKEAQARLDLMTLKKYGDLSEEDVREMVLGDKWKSTISSRISDELSSLMLDLVARIQLLGERYGETIADLRARAETLEKRVADYLDGLNRTHPDDAWPAVLLGEIATFSKGTGLSKSDISISGRFECVHYGELFTQYGAEIRSILSKTDRTDLQVRSQSGDVLMPTSDVTPGGLAKASSIQLNGVILGGDILIIRPVKGVAYGPFLARAIRRDETQILSLVRGSTVYHLYSADMRHFALRLPPLQDQIRIAERLEEADEMIANTKRLTHKEEAITLGVAQKLLSGFEMSETTGAKT